MPHKPPFRFISDAAHGWLEVSRNDLAVIGLSEADFSEFSYKLGGMLYLEEDCDAATFIGTYEAIHGHTPRQSLGQLRGSRLRCLLRLPEPPEQSSQPLAAPAARPRHPKMSRPKERPE